MNQFACLPLKLQTTEIETVKWISLSEVCLLLIFVDLKSGKLRTH